MQEIELPDGSVIEFPDGMSPALMTRVVQDFARPGGILHDRVRPRQRQGYGVARTNQAGQFQIGGPITAGDVRGAAMTAIEPYRQPTGEVVADVLPGTGHMRSAERVQEMMQRLQSGQQSPIADALTMANMTLEGGGMIADLIPYASAGAAAVGGLIPFMARNANQGGSIGGAVARQMGTAVDPRLGKALNLKAEMMFDPNGIDYAAIARQTGWDLSQGQPRQIRQLGQFGIAAPQRGALGYHGSPHTFDRFRTRRSIASSRVTSTAATLPPRKTSRPSGTTKSQSHSGPRATPIRSGWPTSCWPQTSPGRD